MKDWSLNTPRISTSPTPSENTLFGDNVRHVYIERLRETPQACLWDFMAWRDQDAPDEDR